MALGGGRHSMEKPSGLPSEASFPKPGNRRLAAIGLFMGVWLLASCVTLVFMQHNHNPFLAFTSLLPTTGVLLVIALYAALLAACWLAIPRFKIGFLNELIFTGSWILGGLFAPHILTMLVEAFRAVARG